MVIIIDEDIGRLEIEMDDAVAMRILDCAADPQEELEPLPSRRQVITEVDMEPGPLYQLHDQEVLALGGLTRLMDRGDARMTESRQRLDLALKATQVAPSNEGPALQHLDRDRPSGRDLLRLVDERLSPLPLSLLDRFAPTVDSLRRAGLHTLGDILALPAAAIGRRCGRDFCHFLEQVLGQRAEPSADYRPPPAFSDEYWFGYEVRTNQELLPAVQLLLQSLCRFLRNTQLQTGEIRWQLVGVNRRVQEVCVRSGSSHSDWQSWYQLTGIRFEQLQLAGSVEGLALACDQLCPGQQENIDLFSPRNQKEPLASLLDRLRSRLGLQAIEKVGCRDEHLPELAVYVSSDNPGDAPGPGPPCAQRPFWLMPQPQALRQHRDRLYWNGALTLVYGPERIEDNWWQEAVSRDYYVAEDRSGQHYWVFRDRLARRWYVHGIFA